MVVLGELYGVTEHVDESLARLAAAGYRAAGLDFCHRCEPRLALPYDDSARDRGFELLGQLDPRDLVTDIREALEVLGFREIVSCDADFERVPGVRRIDPADLAPSPGESR